MLAELLVRPAAERGPVEAHRTAASGHTPVSARARVDLPAALGPITASTVPALSVEADAC